MDTRVLGIIAGSGALPARVAAAAVAAGRRVFIVGLESFADPAQLAPFPHGFARIGSISSVQFAGILLALQWPLQTMYYLVSIPMVFGCLWVLLLAKARRAPSAEAPSRRAIA